MGEQGNYHTAPFQEINNAEPTGFEHSTLKFESTTSRAGLLHISSLLHVVLFALEKCFTASKLTSCSLVAGEVVLRLS